MADPILKPTDLDNFATIESGKAQDMIDDAIAQAVMIAPCIDDLEDGPKRKAVKAILRAVVLRWNERGEGAITTTQETAGPFSATVTHDSARSYRGRFLPSEIEDLQGICRGGPEIFAVDTAPGGARHPSFCHIYFGGVCTCGVVDGVVYRIP